MMDLFGNRTFGFSGCNVQSKFLSTSISKIAQSNPYRTQQAIQIIHLLCDTYLNPTHVKRRENSYSHNYYCYAGTLSACTCIAFGLDSSSNVCAVN